MPVPIIPLKALAESKSRLAPELNPIERRLLAIAMFEDVLAAVQCCPGFDRALVVSPDREVQLRAAALGCAVHPDPTHDGLNAALLDAFAALPPDAPLMVVAADLPLATAASLGRVLAAQRTADIVVVPSRDGQGTNVLGWSGTPPAGALGKPVDFGPAFGVGSAARHLAIPGAVRLDDGLLGIDIDTADDLRAALPRLEVTTTTFKRARDLRLADRLGVSGGR